MNYNQQRKNSSTVGLHLMCATVFVLFCFGWLYFFEAEVLMMAQHVTSGGMTHYNPLLGAVITTLVLFLLQQLVLRLTGLGKRGHALTYWPSMMLLGLLTSVRQSEGADIEWDFYWWTPVLLLLLWGLIVMLARQYQSIEDNKDFGLFSAPMRINMLLMLMMILYVAWKGNTNAVFHYRMKAESCLMVGDMDGALKAGQKSLESDAPLLMLRMYALARKGELGERLFQYPITATSEQMLPTDSLSGLLMLPADTLYKFLGARPAAPMSPMHYLQLIERKDTLPVGQAVADYKLCGYLIDRNLDGFASEIGRYYTINDSLPRHYREALTLYTHQRKNPVVEYHHPVMDEDYRNLVELEKKYPLSTERKGKVEEQFSGTYWYFYRYP